jgi:hypothetical protein
VPYRDRPEQLAKFKTHMATILEDLNPSEYTINYIHQTDKRAFNRGAIKNIGFLYIKNKYPNDYKNITLVFNDVDTMPVRKGLIDYQTIPGTIKHFYGFRHTLGGIFSIKAADFEKINGFANFWTWGFEDNIINDRVIYGGMSIDRSQFYPYLDSEHITQISDSTYRTVNSEEFRRYTMKTKEGISNISKLVYDEEPNTGFVNVRTFDTGTIHRVEFNREHDLRNGPRPFNSIQRSRRATMGMII